MIDLSSIPTSALIDALKKQRAEITRQLIKLEDHGLACAVDQLVAVEFNIDPESLYLSTRKTSIAFPRQVVMTLLREQGLIWQDCGAHFGKDHGTAMHAAKTVYALQDSCDIFAARLQRLRNDLADIV